MQQSRFCQTKLLAQAAGARRIFPGQARGNPGFSGLDLGRLPPLLPGQAARMPGNWENRARRKSGDAPVRASRSP
jgi:hypothetical protein